MTQIVDQIIDVSQADGQANDPVGDADLFPVFLGYCRMAHCRRVFCQGGGPTQRFSRGK